MRLTWLIAWWPWRRQQSAAASGASLPLALRIGDRVFEPVPVTTLEQDDWFASRVLEFGLDRAAQAVHEADPAAAETATRTILQRLYASGRGCEFLTGCWQERGVPWTPAWATETARWLAQVRDPAAKELVRAQVVQAVMSFFVLGGSSRTTSPTSSPSRPTRRRRAMWARSG